MKSILILLIVSVTLIFVGALIEASM
jgi:hypothetical protein